MKCLDCGNTWKEFQENSVKLISDQSRETKIREQRQYARTAVGETGPDRSADFDHFAATLDRNTNRQTIAKPMAALALALGIGMAGSAWFLNPGNAPELQSTIAFGEISIRERIGRDGKKIITVKGSVENRTSKSATIPPIAIILRQTDGGEIVRWRHASSMPVLKAGAKSRFASSIQYDTPAIAYAEAVFE